MRLMGHVRHRERQGPELSYIEGWHAIAEASRIFGHDRWDRETLDVRCVLARETRGSFLAVYSTKVRLSARAAEETIVRGGHGTGEARGCSPGEMRARSAGAIWLRCRGQRQRAPAVRSGGGVNGL
jgi:hypothetical protein